MKFIFSGSHENLSFGVISYNLLDERKKECNMLEIILVQGFCPLKVEITQFPDGFHLNINLKTQ